MNNALCGVYRHILQETCIPYMCALSMCDMSLISHEHSLNEKLLHRMGKCIMGCHGVEFADTSAPEPSY